MEGVAPTAPITSKREQCPQSLNLRVRVIRTIRCGRGVYVRALTWINILSVPIIASGDYHRFQSLEWGCTFHGVHCDDGIELSRCSQEEGSWWVDPRADDVI